MAAKPKLDEPALIEDTPLWYKDAVIYEVHVRAFCDGNGDGIGDFPGLTQKLDYLQDLGVTALWLLPFYPSPLKTTVTTSPTIRTFTRITARSRTSKYSCARRIVAGSASSRSWWSIIRRTSIHGFSARAKQNPARARVISMSGAIPNRAIRSADHFQGLRAVELGLGSGRARRTTGIVFIRISRI